MNSCFCAECALRLYNTKSYNLRGVGNPFMGNCIIIPNVDYPAYKGGSISFSSQVEIIKDILLPFTGVEDLNLYIVPLIRCNEQISCKVDDMTYIKCLQYFKNDVIKYDFRNILLLGSAARRFLNINISEHLNDMFISKNNRRYVVNYAPLIKCIDDKLFIQFSDNLIRWYNNINNDTFNYNIIRI